jgi:hypothetical protein
MVRQGKARQVKASLGKARQGVATQVKAWIGNQGVSSQGNRC